MLKFTELKYHELYPKDIKDSFAHLSLQTNKHPQIKPNSTKPTKTQTINQQQQQQQTCAYTYLKQKCPLMWNIIHCSMNGFYCSHHAVDPLL